MLQSNQEKIMKSWLNSSGECKDRRKGEKKWDKEFEVKY